MRQTKQAFPFGSTVAAHRMTDSGESNQKYQQFFYDMFNWGVIENAMKWQEMERNQVEIPQVYYISL